MRKTTILSSVVFLLTFLLSCQQPKEGPSTTKATNGNYITNRQPLEKNPYIGLPLGSVKARGWLQQMLKRQKTGATGHLDELYPKVMGETNGWLGGKGDQWERGPYWIHGLLTLAYTLDDPELIQKTTPWIEWILNSQKPNGYFGPDQGYENKPGIQRDNAADWWPRMVVLKILKQYYSATKDERVIDLMSNYFQYQLETLPQKPLDNWTFWAHYRGGDNLMVVYWLYNITGEAFLLDLAELIHKQTFDYTHKFLETKMIENQRNIHCVNLAQGIKEPAVYYQHHPEQKYIKGIKRAFADLKKFSGQPQGMFGGDEALRDNKPVNGVELCSVVEMMYSLETILEITGDVQFADHLEKVAYNALPTQITDDFMNRQYFQQANQVKLTRHYRNLSINHHGTDVCFGLFTGYPCCTSNMHQGWPLLTQNLWHATPDNGLAALVYAPSQVQAKVADDTPVTIIEDTHYPFRDRIHFTIKHQEKSISFPFHLRIPEWCEQAVIKINGKVYDYPEAGQVVKMDRSWSSGDEVELKLPSKVKLSRWYEHSVSVDRGPLTYVLRMEEQWKKVNNTQDPDTYGEVYYEVTSPTPWNYGLVDVPEEKVNEAYQVKKNATLEEYPWNIENAPIQIQANARRIKEWKLYNETAGPMPYSIQWGQPNGKEETITLIPYGCSTLRIAEFPLVGQYTVMGQDNH